MTKAILSLDYDDCSCILFQEVSDHAPQFYRIRVALAKKILEDYFDEIAATHDEVEVYVGSSRQDIFSDNHYMNKHGNGSCFENLEKLCKEKGWTFRRLLLADVHNNLPPGSAMNNESVEYKNCKNFKCEIVKAQINDVKINHPGEAVDFYFFDDDTYNEYIPSIKRHFENNLPNHINKLSLIRYDKSLMVNDGHLPLMSETDIIQPRIKIQEVEKTKNIQPGENKIIKLGLIDHYKDGIRNKENMSALCEHAGLFANEDKKRGREEIAVSGTVKKMKTR